MIGRALGSLAATRAVERAAWVLVVAGVGLVVAPARAPVVAGGATPAPIAPIPAPEHRMIDGSPWLAGNPFSASRHPPAKRWLVHETAADSAEGEAAASGLDGPRLFGTMVGPGGNAALLRLDAATSAARLYLEGDRGGAYRVRRVLDDRVILDGPSGRIELRLRRREARP